MGQQTYYPFFDGDLQAKIQDKLGEDALLVFNENREVYLAFRTGDAYAIDPKPAAELQQVAELIQTHTEELHAQR